MSLQVSNRYFSQEELEAMNFRYLGRNVRISRTVLMYEPKYISIGDDSMVDDFCVLSGNIKIGKNVHIAYGSRIIAGLEGVEMADFSGLAFGVTVFAQSDDYSGNALTNPTVPMQFRKIRRAKVTFGRHVIVGTGSVVLPGVELAEGTSIGACSMVTKSTQPWTIYLGVPAKRLKARSQEMLELEAAYLQQKADEAKVQ